MVANKMQQAVEKLKEEMLKNYSKYQKAEVGISDESIAPYAIWQEYGWVQRVTPKQSVFFAGQGVANPPKPGSSLVSPPRPFFRAAIDAYSEQWAKLFVSQLKAHGINNIMSALVLTADKAASDIRQTVIDGGTPKIKFDERAPLTMELYQLEAQNTKGQKTKKRKVKGGNLTTTKPLVKTGAMLNAIGYQIKK